MKGQRQGRPPPPPHTSAPRGCARRVGRATTGAIRQAPPPPCRGTSAAPRACAVLASCLRRACYEGKTTRAPPPPHTPPPPKGGGCRWGGAKSGPPPEDKAAGWGGSGERVRDGPQDRARGEHAPCKPQRGDHRGCERRVGRATTGATRQAPPPCRGTGAAPRACAVLASCLRHACYEGNTTSPPPPPHTPLPPQEWGMKVERGGQRPTPPPRTKRQGGEAAERGCGTDHTTVPVGSTRRTSPNGGAPGVRTQGRKGDDGNHTASPPPPLQRDKCRASCLRRACDVLTPEDGQRGRPPPPTPFSPTHLGKGRGQRGDGVGTWGGAENRPTRQGERRAAGGGDAKKKQSKPTRQGKKAGRQGPIPQRTGGGRGNMSPQETLVRYPTSGVWGPQRRNPPPPHCGQVPHRVLASCLRRACDMRATTGRRQGRPPPPPTHHRPPEGGGRR